MALLSRSPFCLRFFRDWILNIFAYRFSSNGSFFNFSQTLHLHFIFSLKVYDYANGIYCELLLNSKLCAEQYFIWTMSPCAVYLDVNQPFINTRGRTILQFGYSMMDIFQLFSSPLPRLDTTDVISIQAALSDSIYRHFRIP